MKRAKIDKKGKGADSNKKLSASEQTLNLFLDKVKNQKVYPWIVKLNPHRINMGVPVNFDAAYRHLMNLEVISKPEYIPSGKSKLYLTYFRQPCPESRSLSSFCRTV